MKICEAAARKMIARSVAVKIISFNDGEDVNAALAAASAKAGIPFADLASAVARIPVETPAVDRNDPRDWEPTDVELSYRALLGRQIVAARTILEESRAAVLIICEDGPGGCGPLIKAAKSKGIPVLDMPFGIGESRDYDNFLKDKAREGNLNSVPESAVGDTLRRVAPHWIRTVDEGDVTLMPAEFILARIAVGIDIPLPWVVHGGSADHLLVESEAMCAIYAREGVPSAKMIMTGSIYGDVVADVIASDSKLRGAIEEGRPIDPRRRKVLIAPPPSYHDSHGHMAEFATYEETVRMLAEAALCGGAADVTVSLHPAIRHEDKQIWSRLPVSISDEWLVELLPRHDVLMTSFSSTIRWAIACGKPVVNYDAYRLNLSTYEGMQGVVTLSTLAGVERLMADIASNLETYGRLARHQQARSRRWGELDGHSFDRIWDVIEGSMAGSKAMLADGEPGQATVPYRRTDIYPETPAAEPKHMFVWLCDMIGGASPEVGSLLDVGCASGDFLNYARSRFPCSRLDGIDFDRELVARAQRKRNIDNVWHGDANDLDAIAAGSYDVVTMTGTHSIFEDFRASFSECLRVAKDGGAILVTGLFNTYDVDARIHWKYGAMFDERWHPGYNLFSKKSVRKFLGAQSRVAEMSFEPFAMPFDLMPQNDPVRSWTVRGPKGERILRNGIMLLDLECLVIKLTQPSETASE